MSLFGAIEAGGTKFVCGVGSGPEDLRTFRLPTTSPGATVAAAVAWLREQGPVRSVGIGSFGPVDLDRDSATYGFIMNTPKAEWRRFDLAGAVARGVGAPVAFETDVNAAALGEARWGAARGVPNCLYLTVGTGIGGGALAGGKILHGAGHPEMGHIRIPHDRAADPFPGCCPFHADCLEGLASGPALAARWGRAAGELPPEHPAWRLEAQYLAAALANLSCTLSPALILLGGGVMQQAGLFEMIRADLEKLLGGYIRMPQILAPGLGANAGVLGALALAQTIRAE